MIKLTQRRRLLGGVLLIAAGFWVADHLGGGGTKPRPAQAAPTPDAAPPLTVGEWPEVGELVASVTRPPYQPVEPELDRLPRDLFAPTDHVERMLAQSVPTPPPESQPAPTAGPSFAERHTFSGILHGARPLAVVDQRVLPLQAELDGHVLIEIQRDYVIFRPVAGGADVKLTLRRGR